MFGVDENDKSHNELNVKCSSKYCVSWNLFLCCKTMSPKIFIIVANMLLCSCMSLPRQQCSGVYKLVETGWYKEQITAAGESPLCVTSSESIERYRFTWLRTFDNPIVITLSKSGDNIQLRAVRLDGAGGYDPGKVVEKKVVYLSKAEFDSFKRVVDKLNLWQLKSYEQLYSEELDNLGEGEFLFEADGARWILEGANFTLSHAVDRWSPSEGSFREAALFLLNKSDVSINGPIY